MQWVKGFVLFFLLCAPGLAQKEKTLVVGLHPNVSSTTVLTLYQPVREHLTRTLARPVELRTAPDFRSYIERTLKSEFDVIVTAPHLARLAQQKAGYVPILYYSTELRAYVIATKDGDVRALGDLRNQTVAAPDSLTVITMIGLDFLKRKGLHPNKDFKLFDAKSHNNAALSVANGQSAAAVIGSVPFAQLGPELRGRLRIVAETDSIPSQFILAHSRLGSAETNKVKTALSNYAASRDGKKFMEENGFGGFKVPDDRTMKRLEVYAAEVDRLVAKP